MSEYTELLNINRSNLDEEMEQQARRYMWAIEQSVEADGAVREAAQKLDVVKATVYSRLKSMTTPAGKPFTEKAVEMMLPAEPEYEEAYKELTVAKKNAKLASGGVEAFAHKKTMLAKIADREEQVRFNSGKYMEDHKTFEEDTDSALSDSSRLNRG